MRWTTRWMLVMVAACASSHEQKPAAAPQLARAEPAPPPETKAAGDPDTGGQLAQPQAAPAAVAVADPGQGGQPDESTAAAGPPAGGVGGLNTGADTGIGRAGGSLGGIGAGNPGPRSRDRDVQARIAPGNPQIEGAIDKDEVAKTVRRGLGQLRQCVQNGMKRNPSLSGMLAIQFEIGKNGHVTEAQLVRRIQDDVDACVLAHFRRFVFPKPDKDPVAVVQTFNVSPQ